MSAKYPGGFITKNYVAPTPAAAPGIWTLDQQLQAQKTGTWPLFQYNYIEDCFSTYLYTGDGSSAQNINNGIDLAGKGGMVWVKGRSDATTNVLVDTNRFVSSSNIQCLFSNSTAAASASANEFGSFNSNGFSIPYNTTAGWTNFGTRTFASWTFREQPKFFDVVTYTGNGVDNRDIAHSLGSTPGCIIVKCTNSTPAWRVWHTSLTAGNNMELNATDGQFADTSIKSCTDTTFRTNSGSNSNGSGNTYVAYIFAHNAGGFGLSGTDNVISCGSFTTDSGGNATVSLGYEPAWLMFKCSSNAGQNWEMLDTMRGWSMSTDVAVQANSSAAEAPGGYGNPTATGFVMGGQGNTQTYIYIAIRRGPMKVPTDGTKVFAPFASSAAAGTALTTNFPVDLSISTVRAGDERFFSDRLRGANSPNYVVNKPWISSNSTGAELTNASLSRAWDNTKIAIPPYYGGTSTVWWNFERAPGFFDEVCYTGTGSATTFNHNLTVAPEMVIIKSRSTAYAWPTLVNAIGNTDFLFLNSDGAKNSASSYFNNTYPTSTVFSVGTNVQVNGSGSTFVAYLFATCAGVSKVGSYTGTGATQTIACGFAAGARFVLIKRYDDGSTGNWYVWDTARGMTAGTDPHLLLNSIVSAEVNANWVYTATTGFQIVTSDAGVNASGGSYIFLAVA